MTDFLMIVSTIFATIVGAGGLLFYRQNKKLKAAEAVVAEKGILTKDLENQKSTNDEWIRLYNETKSELIVAQEKINDLQDKLRISKELESQHRVLINDLTWCKCINNDCTERRPPRDFEKKMIDAQYLHDKMHEQKPDKEHEPVSIDGDYPEM